MDGLPKLRHVLTRSNRRRCFYATTLAKAERDRARENEKLCQHCGRSWRPYWVEEQFEVKVARIMEQRVKRGLSPLAPETRGLVLTMVPGVRKVLEDYATTGRNLEEPATHGWTGRRLWRASRATRGR